MQSGGHVFAILAGSGLLYICTISLWVLFVFLLLFYSCPCCYTLFFHPCSACPKKWPVLKAVWTSQLKTGKQLESSINDFYKTHTSTFLILLPHAGYMTHSTALQVLRLANNSYKPTTCQFSEVSALLQQLRVGKKKKKQSPVKKMRFITCTACVNFRVTKMYLQATVPLGKVFRELHLQRASQKYSSELNSP